MQTLSTLTHLPLLFSWNVVCELVFALLTFVTVNGVSPTTSMPALNMESVQTMVFPFHPGDVVTIQ